MEYTGEKPIDPLIVRVYPLSDNQTSSYRLYADASDSEAYKRGICTWTPLSAAQHGDTTAVTIAPVEGSYPGMIEDRAYQIELPGDWPPASVTVNSTNLTFTGQQTEKPGWRYEGNTLTTVVLTPRYSVHNAVTITVRRASGSLASRAHLDGFPGAIARLHGAYDAMNSVWPETWSPNILIDAWETGDRLNYHPETARQEIARFPQLYAQSQAAVQSLLDKENQLGTQPGSGAQRENPERVHLYFQRAAALLKDGAPPTP
jgi:hypothetical protein